MRRSLRLISRLLTLLILVVPIHPIQHAIAVNNQSPPITPTVQGTPGATPLPTGCGSVTPPGQPQAASCLNGFVAIDGQIVGGAEVTITSPRGDNVVLYTQVYSGTESRSSYQLSLSAAPLNIQTGETITVAARYSSHKKSLSYAVQPGSQQVDVVLPRNRADDYVIDTQIWGQGEQGNFNSPVDIAVNSRHDIFVVDSSNHRLQVFNQDGNFVRTWGHRGALPGEFSQPRGIAIDSVDNVYVADSGNNRVQKFDANGKLIDFWGGQGTNIGQFDNPSAITIAQNGDVYVIDTWNARVQVFSSIGTFRLQWGSYGSGNGQFNNPAGIGIDSDNNVYIADYLNHRVQKFQPNGTFISAWGTFGVANGQFKNPTAIAIDTNGDIYVSDTTARIQRFNRTGQWLASWGSPGTGIGQFYNPLGIALDGSGGIYVADQSNDRIQKLTLQGVWQETIGAKGHGNGQFSSPYGLALHTSDPTRLYVADYGNNRIQTFDSNGNWQSIWATVPLPADLVVDSTQNVYVADNQNDRIVKFNSNGQLLLSWGGTGGMNGQLDGPFGLAIDSSDNIYVVEYWNNRIQKFSNNGTWLLGWGSAGSANGQFNHPYDIAIDHSGNIYVADLDNHRVQKFTSAGVWLANWAIETSANPRTLAIDNQNNVYVQSNYTLRKFSSDGQFLARWGNFGVQAGDIYDPGGILVGSNGRVYLSDHSNRVQIFRPMSYTKPIATITHMSATSLGQQDTLIMNGMGQDSDETPTISDYEWVSDKDGIIGTGPTLSRAATTLSSGTHHLSFRARDNEGEWADPVGIDIFVAPQALPSWTMLLYLDGDYSDRGNLFNHLMASFTASGNTASNNLSNAFTNPNVRIAVQIDGPANGDTRRLLLTPGSATTAPQITDISIGEQAMDDPAALSQFLIWGQHSFPADHYYLAIADHGQGIQGVNWDTTSDPQKGAYLTVRELGQALSAPGIAPIDVLHLDACSMNLLEVAYEVRLRVQVMIASQYLSWTYFDYYAYQSAIGLNTTALDVAQGIAQRYAAQQTSDYLPYTIAVLDLRRAEPLLTAVDNLAAELSALVNNNQSNKTLLDTIWHASQKFDSNGDFLNNDADMYVDLLDWANRIQIRVSSPAVKARAAALIAELTGSQPFIVSNDAKSGTTPLAYANGAYIDLTNSNGVSIFYPQHQDTVAFDNYINNRFFSFSSASRWPDFLVAGVGALSGPGTQLEPLPGPLESPNPNYRAFLPLAIR